MQIVLAQPRGFCAGVVRAVAIVEQALGRFGAPVYVFHEIVHNGHVVADLRARGAVFVDDIDAIPTGAVAIFSAHGVADAVVRQAEARRLRIVDATCPLVARVHQRAQRYARLGFAVVIVGHRGHEEVVGTMGSVEVPMYLVENLDDARALELPPGARVAYVTQTTLSLDDTREIIAELQRRFPGIEGPALDHICYATQNRQNAVRTLAAMVDRVLVVGARNSSNSNRLREVAAQMGVPALLIQDASEIDDAWLRGSRAVGITAGASTPEVLVSAVCARLRELGATAIRSAPGPVEQVTFRLPPGLSVAASAVPAPMAA
jgi:4-hydroxy-3-methylbut-2-en-1-yl diphosphate reductase